VIPRSASQIERSDIEALLATPRVEDRRIDYKQCLPGNSDDDKREFLADVSSFANASGGDLVYGVEEASGIPTAISGLPVTNFDAERLRLQNLIRDGVQPRLPAIEIIEVPGFTLGPVIVARVHESWLAPHMVTLKNLSRFYVRDAGQRHQMDVQELRAAFTAGDELARRSEAFRDARLGKIIAGETPIAIWDHPILVVHAMPMGAVFGEQRVDVYAVGQKWATLNASSFVYAATTRYNLEGLLVYSGVAYEADQKSIAYLQLFRNGGVEAVATFSARSQALLMFDGRELETSIVRLLEAVRRFHGEWQLTSPLYISIALLRARGVSIYIPAPVMALSQHRSYDRETVILPGVVLQPSDDIAASLRPVFDTLWQGAGFSKSYSYGEDGVWQPPRR